MRTHLFSFLCVLVCSCVFLCVLVCVFRCCEDGMVGPIVFSPKFVGSFESILLLKNNLTKISIVKLTGTGGKGKITFKQTKTITTTTTTRAAPGKANKGKSPTTLNTSVATLIDVSDVVVN